MGSDGDHELPHSKPHVVILTVPAPGHIIPSLALAKALAQRGVKVTLLSSGCVPERLLRGGEDAALDVTVGTVLDDPLMEPENPMALVPWLSKLPPEEMAERAVGVIKDLRPPPCCFVSDVFISWTGMVEEQLGIPRHFLVTMSASSLSFMFSVPLFAREGVLPLDLAADVELPVPGVGNIPKSDVWEYFIQGGMFQMDPMIRCLQAFTESFPRATYLVNSTEELEPEAFRALSEPVPFTGQVAKVVSVGPLEQVFASIGGDANSSEKEQKTGKKAPLASRVEEWLEAQPEGSVMYISFGTIFSLAPEQVAELAHGVEASGQRFLWVIRPPNKPHIMLSQQPSSADIAAILPPGFEERTKGRGLLHSSWVPQPKILAHKAVGLFLSHCGWNSTLEAISTSTPILGRPLFTDQWFNATILENHFRIGTVLRDGKFERGCIEASIKGMMEGDEGRDARRNVARLNKALRDAASERSCGHLDEYVSELFAMDKRLNHSK